MKTALRIASDMPLPDYAQDALRYDRHPQERTLAFHRFYGAPVYEGKPDRTFSHMTDERVAFRAAFIVSEAFEMLADGLGLKDRFPDHKELCQQILQGMREGKGRDLVSLLDALGDLNVVVNGFAIELGVDMKLVDQEVCASNFTKADESGNPIIGDGVNGPEGKVLKGPNFMEPQLARTFGLGEEA